MSTQRTRTDELLKTWMAATAKPTPDFREGSARRRRPGRALVLILAVIVLILVALGTLAIGALIQRRTDSDLRPRSSLTLPSPRSRVPQAYGSRFRFPPTLETGSAAPMPGPDRLLKGSLLGNGRIGGAGGGRMSLFGGPSSGGVIVADGLFVQTEGQPWVRVPEREPSAPGVPGSRPAIPCHAGRPRLVRGRSGHSFQAVRKRDLPRDHLVGSTQRPLRCGGFVVLASAVNRRPPISAPRRSSC